MSGPDGPEQRTADAEERTEYEYDELDRLEQREEEQVDESLLEVATKRLESMKVSL